MDASDSRLEACRRAGKALAIAKQSGDDGFHSEQIHAQVYARATSILAAHPAKTFTPAQHDAICELLASALLMNLLATQPKQGWLSRAIGDFRGQSPLEQISSMVKVSGFVAMLVGAASVAWSYTPTVIHAIGSRMVMATVADQSQPLDSAQKSAATPSDATSGK